MGGQTGAAASVRAGQPVPQKAEDETLCCESQRGESNTYLAEERKTEFSRTPRYTSAHVPVSQLAPVLPQSTDRLTHRALAVTGCDPARSYPAVAGEVPGSRRPTQRVQVAPLLPDR